MEALCSHFILVRNDHQCIFTALELGRKPEVNVFEQNALALTLPGKYCLLLNRKNSINKNDKSMLHLILPYTIMQTN